MLTPALKRALRAGRLVRLDPGTPPADDAPPPAPDGLGPGPDAPEAAPPR